METDLILTCAAPKTTITSLQSVTKPICQVARKNLPARLVLAAAGALFLVNVFAAESNIEIEGTVDSIRPVSGRQLELGVASGTNHVLLEVEDTAGNSPTLSSRIRVPTSEPQASRQDNVRTLTVSGLDQIQFLAGS